MSRKNTTNIENFGFTKRLIEACGTSKPAEIRRMLNISYQAAKNYVNGRLPDSHVLLAISECTSCSIHWLLTGEGEKYINPLPEKSTQVLTDEIRAFIRQEVYDLLNDILSGQRRPVEEKVIVIDSKKVKDEKATDKSGSLHRKRESV